MQHIFILVCALILHSAAAYGESYRSGNDGNVIGAEDLFISHARHLYAESGDIFPDEYGLPDEFDGEPEIIYDPFESMNRMTFAFNDRLYFYVLKPVARGYSRLVPEKTRVAVRRFFSNVTTPIRLVSSLLQLKFQKAGDELARFMINTTVGLAGFRDPAADRWNIYSHREDVGQTLGFYGAGPGFYLNLPFFGPSSLRDTAGLVGDILLDPVTYIFPHDRFATVGVVVFDRGINETSLNIGIYEDIKSDALDPYVFIRDAYHQHRENSIRE